MIHTIIKTEPGEIEGIVYSIHSDCLLLLYLSLLSVSFISNSPPDNANHLETGLRDTFMFTHLFQASPQCVVITSPSIHQTEQKLFSMSLPWRQDVQCRSKPRASF